MKVCALVEGFDPKKPDIIVPCALSNVRGQFAFDVGAPGKYTLFYYDTLVYSNYANSYLPQYVPFFRHPSHPAPEAVLGGAKAAASVAVMMPPRHGLLVGRGFDAVSYEFDFVGVRPGRRRVWAVDGAGREGSKSPWRMFKYLR